MARRNFDINVYLVGFDEEHARDHSLVYGDEDHAMANRDAHNENSGTTAPYHTYMVKARVDLSSLTLVLTDDEANGISRD